MTALIRDLGRVVGEVHVLTGAQCQPFEVDWRKRMSGKALCVVRPSQTHEVAAVIKLCQAHGAPIVPQGGNTGLVLGSTPDTSGQQVVLNLQRMNRIRHIDVVNATLTAEAGVILQNLQIAAHEKGLLYPLSLGSQGSCTLGGNLSTNAGGTQVLRYGNTRDLCLGLEVVTAQGEVWHGLSGLRKDNTGYDLRDLFIGAEGTLGIITAATMKLFPLPRDQRTAWASVPSLQAAIDLLHLTRTHLGAGLTGFELMNQFSLQLVNQHFPDRLMPLWKEAPYCVLLELSVTDIDGNQEQPEQTRAQKALEHLLELALSRGHVNNAVVAKSLGDAQNLWHLRDCIPLAQTQEGLNIKHDISLPISKLVEFCNETQAALTQAIPGIRLVNFGHLGDGNLHYNVQCPLGVDATDFLTHQEARVNDLVYDAVARFGGSISAEHGIGHLKVQRLAQYKDPVALALMQRIKLALDPHGLLNPKRILDAATPP